MDTTKITEIEQALLAWWIIFCAMLMVVIGMIIVVVWTWCRCILRKDQLTIWTCCRCIKSNDPLARRDVELSHISGPADQSTPQAALKMRVDSNDEQPSTPNTSAASNNPNTPARHHTNPEPTVLFCDSENLETQISTDVHHQNIPNTEVLDGTDIMTDYDQQTSPKVRMARYNPEISTDIPHQQTILKTENPAENSHSMTDDEQQTIPKSRMIQDKKDLFPKNTHQQIIPKIQTVPGISHLISERNDQTAPACKPEVPLFIDQDIKDTTQLSEGLMEKIPLLDDTESSSGMHQDTQGEGSPVTSAMEGATARRGPAEHSEIKQNSSVGENVPGQNQEYPPYGVPSLNVIEQGGTKATYPNSYDESEHNTNDLSREHTLDLDKYAAPTLTGNRNQ